MDETLQGELEIVATEAARNVLLHGKGGEIVLQPWVVESRKGIDLLALDRGNGIANVPESLRDGHSTRGTSGTGMGAMKRLSSSFEVFTAAGKGAAVFAEISTDADAHHTRPSAVSVPKHGEMVCGDGWYYHLSGDTAILMVADGLGDGAGANAAAREAVRCAAEHAGESNERLIARLHGRLQKTRGAAVAIARMDLAKNTISYLGVGNIAGAIHSAADGRRLVTHNGTVGLAMPRTQDIVYEWPKDSLLIMHSDGISASWEMGKYPGLQNRHPTLIAGVLFRDFNRRRDDATIVVLRNH
jgi:anti-sigma regulatory factor (Ser/Thr protein kinase)